MADSSVELLLNDRSAALFLRAKVVEEPRDCVAIDASALQPEAIR
jgi:hypothetical protein